MKSSNRSKTAAAQQAEYQAWYEEQVRLGILDIEGGRIVSDENANHRRKRQMTHQLPLKITGRKIGRKDIIKRNVGSSFCKI